MADETLAIEDAEEVEDAPEDAGNIFAFNSAARMTYKETLAWLDGEANRAGMKMRDAEGGHNMQGCRLQYEACQQLHDTIKPWGAGNATKDNRAKLTAALKQPINLMTKLAEIKAGLQ